MHGVMVVLCLYSVVVYGEIALFPVLSVSFTGDGNVLSAKGQF